MAFVWTSAHRNLLGLPINLGIVSLYPCKSEDQVLLAEIGDSEVGSLGVPIHATTYRLRMPASYRIHPVLNMAHLELYRSSDPDLGERPVKNLNRADFTEIPEYEVEKILKDRWRKARNGRRTQELLTRFVGYDSSYDEWLTRRQLKNAPDILQAWDWKGVSRV